MRDTFQVHKVLWLFLKYVLNITYFIMKQNLRLDFAFPLLRSRLVVPSPIFCSCGRNASFSTSVQRAGSISYTEKIRRKIWGTDQPPGQEDPYGGPSALEQYRRENSKKGVDIQDRTQVPTQSSSSAPRYNSELATYEPATTWDDLEVVGEPQENKFYFTGFLPVRIPKDRNKVTAALRQAIIEVFALKQADKSLSLLRDSGRTDFTSHVRVKISRPLTAKVILEFPETTSEAELVEYLTRVDESASESDVSIIREDAMADALDNISNNSAESAFVEGDGEHQNLRYSAQLVSWDPVWLQVSLDDPEVKFAVSHNKSMFFCS